jgi:hypothetical protein
MTFLVIWRRSLLFTSVFPITWSDPLVLLSHVSYNHDT